MNEVIFNGDLAIMQGSANRPLGGAWGNINTAFAAGTVLNIVSVDVVYKNKFKEEAPTMTVETTNTVITAVVAGTTEEVKFLINKTWSWILGKKGAISAKVSSQKVGTTFTTLATNYQIDGAAFVAVGTAAPVGQTNPIMTDAQMRKALIDSGKDATDVAEYTEAQVKTRFAAIGK